MPDLSTVYLPPFPELCVDASGNLAGDQAGDDAAATATATAVSSIDAALASASPSASVDGGGGAPLMLPVECQWSRRVRTFDVAGAGAAPACPAARRGGKKPSLAPLQGPSLTQAPELGPTLEERVSEWAARKTAAGVPAHHCVLPFLTGAPKAFH
nr:unnamed protein product [Digitaria exilis]